MGERCVNSIGAHITFPNYGDDFIGVGVEKTLYFIQMIR